MGAGLFCLFYTAPDFLQGSLALPSITSEKGEREVHI